MDRVCGVIDDPPDEFVASASRRVLETPRKVSSQRDIWRADHLRIDGSGEAASIAKAVESSEQKRRYHAAVIALPLRDKIAMLIRIHKSANRSSNVSERDSVGRHAPGESGG